MSVEICIRANKWAYYLPMELLRFNFLYLRRWLAFALLPMQDVDEIEEALDNMEALREIGIFE